MNNQIICGRAPQAVIQRSLASASVLAEVIHQKFELYVPLYRQVKVWRCLGLNTNDKNQSKWVIRASKEWLEPIYDCMVSKLCMRNVLHVDETNLKIINRSDGKSGRSNAYNWVFRSIKHEGPEIIIFHADLTRKRDVLKNFLQKFSGTVICDGYNVYNQIPSVVFANCWVHVRRYWILAKENGSKLGAKAVEYCDKLFALERKFLGKSPSERKKLRQEFSKPILDKFILWIKSLSANEKSPLGRAIKYTLGLDGLTKFIDDGRIEIHNNPAENAIRPSVIGRKNWLFSTSEDGAKANAVCLSLVETAKANRVNVSKYLKKLFEELPKHNFKRNPEIIHQFMPWSKQIKENCI